ncbi:MAG: sel1 repeat family protein [Candidatus Synoicihabitans palmerolidicus]|nr:sel1 repeat family protein [Candidatus Synoicihabitans palmerolidicus]
MSPPPMLVSTTGGGPQWETIPEFAAAAAAKGIPLACFQYAQLLEEGDDDLPAAPERAIERYETAAAAGYGEAIFRLGKINHDGLLGQRKNYDRALELYPRAAVAGVPEAIYNVGAMYVSDRGVKRNYVAGLAWLLLAAEQGSDPGSVDQVKHRLRKRPEMITAAEKRLAGRKAEFTAPSANTPGPVLQTKSAPLPSLAPTAPPLATPPVNNIRIAPSRPTFTPSAPTIGMPSISIPQPAPKPIPPPPKTILLKLPEAAVRWPCREPQRST